MDANRWLTFLTFLTFWLLFMKGLSLSYKPENWKHCKVISIVIATISLSNLVMFMFLRHHYGIPCSSTQVLFATENPVFILVSETQTHTALSA